MAGGRGARGGRGLRACRGVALGLALAGLPVPEAGAPPAPPGEVRAQREALGELRRRLDDVRARATAARKREASLLAELEEIDGTLARKRAELVRLDLRMAGVAGELETLEGRRGRVAEETVSHQAALSARLRSLGRLAAAPRPPPPLAGHPDVLRLRAMADLGRIARLDLDRLATFEATAERLVSRQEAVERVRRELVALRRAVDTERDAVAEQAQRRRTLLASVQDDRATHERMVRELEDAARRLEVLVRDLARKAEIRRAAVRPDQPAPPRGPAVGLGRLRGELPWPVEGRIVAGFGRQVHPRFGTRTMRHGVDIEAVEGAPVRAVAAGTVLYHGWLRGYGTLVVLDHGEGYYTLYAHAVEVSVDEGDRVRSGQTIGRVGESGPESGPRLYFEVRHQGRAEDPEPWLRGRP